MPRLLTLVLVSISVLLGGLTANAQVQRYEKEKVRQLLFELEKNPPTTHMIVQGQPSTEQGERLIEYYSQVIEPLFENINDIVFDYRTKSLLIDSGSYNDEGEYKLFQAEFQKAAQAYNEFSVSPQVTAHLTEFARLAEGLSGEMPYLARKIALDRQVESFS